MGKILKNLLTSNYRCLCQNSCSWNICFEKKPKESAVETFKNISSVGVHCRCIKDDFAAFCRQIFEKIISEDRGWLLSLEFKVYFKKFILESQPALLLICKSFVWYQAETRRGTQTSLVTRLGLFHVISSEDYILQLLKNLKLNTKLAKNRTLGIHIKIYLWSFVDYHHLKKYFWN